MKRSLVIVSAAALVGAVACLASCSSFGDGDTPASGVDSGVVADGSVMTPDGMTVEAGGRSFCEAFVGALLCDDFEQAGRSATAAGPWARTLSEGGPSPTLVPGFDSAHAWSVDGMMPDKSTQQLETTFDPTQSARITFRLRMDRFVKLATTNERSHLSFARFHFAEGLDVEMILEDDSFHGYIRGNLSGEENRFFTLPSLAPRLGDWLEMRIEVELKPAAQEYRIFMNGALLAQYDGTVRPSATFRLGAGVSAFDADVALAIDDVVITKL